MGSDIDTVSFTPQDYVSFKAALEENLGSLGELLADPAFGVGPGSIGSELEMYIVDERGNPLSANQEILTAADDPQLTLELNRYNLEYNLSPYALTDAPFASTEAEILQKLETLRKVAASFGARIVPIGILPTLRQSDFGSHCITDRKRFHALVSQLIRRRGNKFRIDINGDDPLKLDMSDITLEGANTSFQVHYRVNPADYADTFNAVQLVTPLVLALGANSPTLFGHSLWHETRIPLFKQSIDTRHLDRYSWNEPARVSFGQGWVRQGAQELFSEVVRIFPSLLPVRHRSEQQADSSAPSLAELRMHQSTVWLWNRPVYDPVDGGQLRIEMRALPAGPTAVDMVANAAFLIGLAEGIRPHINRLLPALPFRIAEHNFYRAAQHGLDAPIVWPQLQQTGCCEQSVSSVIEQMLPYARSGLAGIGISDAESERYLGVIEERLEHQQSGAIWQKNMLARLKKDMPLERALQQLLEKFHTNSLSNAPVAQWQL